MAKKSAQNKSSSAGKSQPKPAPSSKTSRAASRAAGASVAAGGRVAELQNLISLMVEKDVVEVEIEEAGSRWRIRRAEPHAVAYAAPAPMAMAHAPLAHAPMPHAVAAHGAAAGHAAAEPAGEVFKSPMVGTFYRAPSPEAEVFCKPGDRVSAERTICIIEAMKVMNEIKAEREFEILDILVKNGESVEFGQPLFLIR